MNTPIFPQVIYPIGELPEGSFYAVVDARGFHYLRDLPDLDFDEEPDTFVDDGPPTLRDEDMQALTKQQPTPWWRRAVSWWQAA